MGTRQGSGGDGRILRGAAAVVAVLTLAAITGCGDRFPDPEQTGEFNRVVLLEEGTGTWCINCPDAAENIQALLEADTGGLIVLALHSQESDPYTTAETEARLTRLGVSAYPTLVFDGVEVNVGAMEVSQMQQMLADRRALGSPVKIELSASLTSDSVSYEITIIVSDKTPENIESTLRIALVEESVDYSNAIWDGLHHVVRRLPAAGSGDELTLQPGDTVNLHRALPLDLAWGTPLMAVVWVEGADLEVYQAAAYELVAPEAGDFSIEVVGDSIKTDTLRAMVNFDFTLKNHTGNDLTLTVDVPEATQELPTGWWFSLCDSATCFPSLPVDCDIPANTKVDGYYVTIGSYGEGTEGRLVLEVTDGGEEVDRQSFTLKIAQ